MTEHCAGVEPHEHSLYFQQNCSCSCNSYVFSTIKQNIRTSTVRTITMQIKESKVNLRVKGKNVKLSLCFF